MLLYHVPCPTSFVALRTVHGKIFSTFKEARDHLGLLQSDQEYHQCLEEAATFKSAHALRILFITILVHSSPADPHRLFDQHKSELFDDCRQKLQASPFNLPSPTNDDINDLGLSLLANLAEQ